MPATPAAVELAKEALPTLSRQARSVESAKESNAMTTITTPSSLALVPRGAGRDEETGL
jgi:hypothetical protein